MPSRNEPMEALIDALQVIALAAANLRRTTSEMAEDFGRIEAATVRAISVSKQLREP